uniref:Protein kinase domain-containing protein n=1 Tax=Caenorhabditis japonica TaxID=281687 RepID=A0A8R1DEQ9_CAEJA
MMHPEIIVEEVEDEEYSSLDAEEYGQGLVEDDVATPLRPADTFPLKRKNSPAKMTEENLQYLKAIHTDFREYSTASPTSTSCSTMSRYEFTNWRINDEVMSNMMHISTICERDKICRTSKYVYTITMASYTVTEWKLSGSTPKECEKVSKLIENLCIQRHKRLAPIYGYHWKTSTDLLLFRAHVPCGTVGDLVKRSAIQQETALRYIVHVIDALSFLHDRNYVHGKVNASNLLLTISNNVLLADPYIEGLPTPQKRRALLASPPEAFENWESYPCLTPSSDMWSVGCVLVTMVTRYPPFLDYFMHFHGENLHRELITEWTSRRQLVYSSKTLIPEASKELRDLADQLFVINSANRPSAHHLLDAYGSKSRKTSIRNSLTSLAAAKELDPPSPTNEFDLDRENDEQHIQLEKLIKRAEKMQEGGFFPFVRWYCSRVLFFTTLLLKWIGMVLCAATSLAVVAGSVFLAIFVIYNGIQVTCQCTLNEGFIVLIALIILPILILLTTLCCNNSLEKYQADVENGKLERSCFVLKTPKTDIVACGYILVEGRIYVDINSEENTRKMGIAEGLAQLANRDGIFNGVARIA